MRPPFRPADAFPRNPTRRAQPAERSLHAPATPVEARCADRPGLRAVKVRCWGVRGSIPVPGPGTARWGGNSSCVELRAPGEAPLVLDAGTGARELGGALLREGVSDVHMLLTHFHTDHVFGFPFFGPLYAPSCKVDVGLQGYDAGDAQARLGAYLNGVFHPVRAREFPAKPTFHGVRPARAFELGPYRIEAIALNHPGGALGYRIEAGGWSVCYLTDTAPLARPGEGAVDGKAPPGPERRLLKLMEGADLVIMDTMFSWEEYLEKMTWGHAYPEYGASLCALAEAKRLLLFHHAPDAEDDALDALDAKWRAYEGLPVQLAREKELIDLSEGP